MVPPVVECVPNISEGRDAELVSRIVSELRGATGINILRCESNPDANRTVITMAGSPESVLAAGLRLYKLCLELIDMGKHSGVHPRIGAVDVFPLVPLQGISMLETVELSKQLADRVAEECGVPLYLYEYSAVSAERSDLAVIRRGNYEGLEAKLQDPRWQPDFGPAKFVRRFGASVIGARQLLVAYNILLDTADWGIASEIASELRELRLQELPGVKAIGWMMPCFGCAQVSTNITRPNEVGLVDVYRTVARLAEKKGVSVLGSEMVGLVPEISLFRAGVEVLSELGEFRPGTHEDVLQAAVDYLGFEYLGSFDLDERVLDRRLRDVAEWRSDSVSLFVS